MIENGITSCRFGIAPRPRHGAAVAAQFGDPVFIAPHFDALPAAEQKAAVILMRERGESDAAIARALGRDEAAVRGLAVLRCGPLRSSMDTDAIDGRGRSGLMAQPVSRHDFDLAIDDALMALDALRVQAGAGLGDAFDMTLDTMAQACGFGTETARRRLRELENRKWIWRQLRPGLPPLVSIDLAGLSRLEALGGLDASSRRGQP